MVRFLENEDYREVCTKIYTSCGAAHEAVDYEITLEIERLKTQQSSLLNKGVLF